MPLAIFWHKMRKIGCAMGAADQAQSLSRLPANGAVPESHDATAGIPHCAKEKIPFTAQFIFLIECASIMTSAIMARALL
jgi:hypothetical protein